MNHRHYPLDTKPSGLIALTHLPTNPIMVKHNMTN